MSSWSPPETRTRLGASHARKGSVCQDASDWLSVSDRSGRPVQLMAVADGHGGQRYTRSEVGSALACQLALERLARQLEQWSSGGADASQRWLAWLRDVFPRELHQRWLEAVEQHWRQEAAGDAGDFSPLPYGTTLAVVVMTPGWWGHTGLGDWDLVRLEPGGTAELLSEEAEPEQGGGEATFSLCLSHAYRHFAGRTAVYPLTPQQPAFSLLLSTDGVRKSCSTDADFFTIADYLCGKADLEADLDADLDRISSQGSGDDVSVAIGRWRGGASSPATPSRPQGRRAAASGAGPLPAPGSTSRPGLPPWISLAGVGLLLAGGGLAAAWFGLGWRPPASLESLLGRPSSPQPPPPPPGPEPPAAGAHERDGPTVRSARAHRRPAQQLRQAGLHHPPCRSQPAPPAAGPGDRRQRDRPDQPRADRSPGGLGDGAGHQRRPAATAGGLPGAQPGAGGRPDALGSAARQCRHQFTQSLSAQPCIVLRV